MKKLITIILILSMLIPAAAALADTAMPSGEIPISGFWYVLVYKEQYSEKIQKAWGNNPFTSRDLASVVVYNIRDNGEIYSCSNLFQTRGAEARGGSICGSWVMTKDGQYDMTLTGRGSGQAYIEDDKLYVVYDKSGGHIALKRIEPLYDEDMR